MHSAFEVLHIMRACKFTTYLLTYLLTMKVTVSYESYSFTNLQPIKHKHHNIPSSRRLFLLTESEINSTKLSKYGSTEQRHKRAFPH